MRTFCSTPTMRLRPCTRRRANGLSRRSPTTAPSDCRGRPVAAFLRIVTNPKLPGARFTLEEAVQIVDRWLEQPGVQLLAPGDRHWPVLRQTIVGGQARGPLITDGLLAALTIECGGVLYTTDRDFARLSVTASKSARRPSDPLRSRRPYIRRTIPRCASAARQALVYLRPGP